jgi:hypothetical protein
MDIFKMIKGLFSKQVDTAVSGAADNLKDQANNVVENIADTVKQHTPDMLDGMVDNVADKVEAAINDVDAGDIVNKVTDSVIGSAK